MKFALFALSTLILLGLPGTASADFQSGNELYAICQDFELVQANSNAHLSVKQMVNASLCAGYVEGVADAQQGTLYGLSSKATTEQLVDVVFKYLGDHPERRHLGASSLIAVALQRAYGVN
jgi:hypothetical protein